MPRHKRVQEEEEGEGIITEGYKFLTGNYPGEKTLKKLLNEHGDAKVTSMYVGRDKVGSAIETVLNLVAAGKFKDAKSKAGYDKLFHLFCEISLSDGYSFRIEKNEKFTIGNPQRKSNTETMNVPIGKSVTLAMFMNNAIKSVGDKNFFTYSAFEYNCQHFIQTLLKANGLLTSALDKFIFQDISLITAQIPSYTGKIANTVTDFAASVKSLFTGSGIEKGMPRINALEQPAWRLRKGANTILSTGEIVEEPINTTYEGAITKLQNGEKVAIKRKRGPRKLNYDLSIDNLQAGKSTPIPHRNIGPTIKSKKAIAMDKLQDIPLEGEASLKNLIQHIKGNTMKGKGFMDTIKNVAKPILEEAVPAVATSIMAELQNPNMDPKLRMGILKLIKMVGKNLPKTMESPVAKLEEGKGITAKQAEQIMGWIKRHHQKGSGPIYDGIGLYLPGEKPSSSSSANANKRLMEENQRLKQELAAAKEGKGLKGWGKMKGGTFDGVGLSW